MEQQGFGGIALENADRPDPRPCRDPKPQADADGKRSKIVVMAKYEERPGVGKTAGVLAALANKEAGPIISLPMVERCNLVIRRPRRAIGPFDYGTEGREGNDQVRIHDIHLQI